MKRWILLLLFCFPVFRLYAGETLQAEKLFFDGAEENQKSAYSLQGLVLGRPLPRKFTVTDEKGNAVEAELSPDQILILGPGAGSRRTLVFDDAAPEVKEASENQGLTLYLRNWSEPRTARGVFQRYQKYHIRGFSWTKLFHCKEICLRFLAFPYQSRCLDTWWISSVLGEQRRAFGYLYSRHRWAYPNYLRRTNARYFFTPWGKREIQNVAKGSLMNAVYAVKRFHEQTEKARKDSQKRLENTFCRPRKFQHEKKYTVEDFCYPGSIPERHKAHTAFYIAKYYSDVEEDTVLELCGNASARVFLNDEMLGGVDYLPGGTMQTAHLAAHWKKGTNHLLLTVRTETPGESMVLNRKSGSGFVPFLREELLPYRKLTLQKITGPQNRILPMAKVRMQGKVFFDSFHSYPVISVKPLSGASCTIHENGESAAVPPDAGFLLNGNSSLSQNGTAAVAFDADSPAPVPAFDMDCGMKVFFFPIQEENGNEPVRAEIYHAFPFALQYRFQYNRKTETFRLGPSGGKTADCKHFILPPLRRMELVFATGNSVLQKEFFRQARIPEIKQFSFDGTHWRDENKALLQMTLHHPTLEELRSWAVLKTFRRNRKTLILGGCESMIFHFPDCRQIPFTGNSRIYERMLPAMFQAVEQTDAARVLVILPCAQHRSGIEPYLEERMIRALLEKLRTNPNIGSVRLICDAGSSADRQQTMSRIAREYAADFSILPQTPPQSGFERETHPAAEINAVAEFLKQFLR